LTGDAAGRIKEVGEEAKKKGGILDISRFAL
jgi:hypothetical protein